MTGKDLFKVWAPTTHERWTRFAKPALFVHVTGFSISRIKTQIPKIPMEIFKHRNDGTAFIVDLPGATSVESGLALAELGFQPVPLYNGINEQNIGGLREVVNNAPIIDALLAGSECLKKYKIGEDALPVFMLDYNRNEQIPISLDMYDNRWSIEPEDMPDASYIKNAGINRVAVWTKGEVRSDLIPIIDSYRDMGIEIVTFCDGKIMRRETPVQHTNNIGLAISSASLERQEKVRKFENARFALMLLTGMAIINLFFMFLVHEEPILWTMPCIMWLTYLWVPETVGDLIAILFVAMFVALYFLSQKHRILMIVALGLVAVDALVFYVYALSYGLIAFVDGDLFYAILVFGFPIFCLVLLVKGVTANLKDLDNNEYFAALDTLDGFDVNMPHIDSFSQVIGRRRHFRGFRGYGGYGGSGLGGYKGGGYKGSSGGFGGGFGG